MRSSTAPGYDFTIVIQRELMKLRFRGATEARDKLEIPPYPMNSNIEEKASAVAITSWSRIRRWIGIALLLLPLAVVLAMIVRMMLEANAEWRVLPTGGKVRIFSVTHGTRHHVSFPCNSWSAHYRRVVAGRGVQGILHGSLFYREHGGSGASSSKPSLVVWFQVGDHPGLLSYEGELQADDGHIIRSAGRSGNSTASTYFIASLNFPEVPVKSPTLRLQAKLDGEPYTFEFANPAYEP